MHTQEDEMMMSFAKKGELNERIEKIKIQRERLQNKKSQLELSQKLSSSNLQKPEREQTPIVYFN